MTPTLKQMIDKFPELIKLEMGDSATRIEGLQTPKLASENQMVFLSEPKHLAEASSTQAMTWVIHLKMKDSLEKKPKNLLISPNPYLAMAMVSKEFFPNKPGVRPVDGHDIHPSAVISSSARLGAGVRVGPGAVIGDRCEIADEAVIGANAVLEPFVKVGARTHIHPLVFVGHSCEIGSDCEIKPNSSIGGEGFGFAQDQKGHHHRITHYGRVIIEDRVHIGANVQIDRGTFEDSRIGEGTKIDNHCHFGHNIQIGKHTIIVGGMLVAGSVQLGSHCVFGGRTTLKGHIKIGDHVHLMGLSSIGKDITEPGQYGGPPIQPVKDILRQRALIPLLPEMRKQILRILKKLEMEE